MNWMSAKNAITASISSPWIPFQRVAGGLGLGRAANACWFTEPT